MKHQKRGYSLTLLFALLTFGILAASVAVAAALSYVLTRFGILPIQADRFPESLQLLIFASVVSVIVGTLLSMLAVRIPLRPINWLIDQMNRLADGDFRARVHFKKPISMIPAFLQVEESFNKMAQELGDTEMLRQDFINNFSHEFKTPIVSIAGFAKLLQRADLDEQQRAEYINAIVEESGRLSSMATNVLKLTKVENQTILTGVTEYNLSEQLRSAALLLEHDWTAKNIELDMEFSEVMIRANEELMKEVWINLLHNAIKFSPEYGPLQVRIFQETDAVRVTITNSGEIPEEEQKRIFRKFYQADRSHFSAGNGVGLSIVKKIVELHQGSVQVESQGGAVIFTVTLPGGEEWK
ncbi:MAG: ATP-binding protein [Faecousia sp.]